MEFLKIKGCSIAIKKSFSAPPDKPVMIFLHEGLGSIDFWRSFPDLMTKQTGLPHLVYDRPGYGKSDPFPYEWGKDYHMVEAAEYLHTIIKKYEIIDPVLIGHSDGGTIGLLHASKFPEKTRAVVSIGAHVFNDKVTRDGIKKASDAYEKTSLKAKLEEFHNEKTDSVFWAWSDTWLSAEFRSWDIRPVLRKIVCPVLAIEGKNDPYSAGDQSIETAKATGGKAILLEGLKHSPHTEDPELSARVIKGFLESSGIICPRSMGQNKSKSEDKENEEKIHDFLGA